MISLNGVPLHRIAQHCHVTPEFLNSAPFMKDRVRVLLGSVKIAADSHGVQDFVADLEDELKCTAHTFWDKRVPLPIEAAEAFVAMICYYDGRMH